MAFQGPDPRGPLDHKRVLSPTCSLRVSPLQLGAMSIGKAWEGMMGSMDKESSFKLLDAFRNAGGNLIDTANNYQERESEQWIGEWMKERNCRDEMVIATKYTTGFRGDLAGKASIDNFQGNGVKSMHVSLANSLKMLQTDYVDILYLHWWDYTTGPEEVMQGLNNLVRAGKVLYLGVSDTPAWIVSKANQYARDHGLAQFVIYQGKWSIIDRTFEREVLPMVIHERMAIAPWGALGSGRFQSKAQLEERKKAGEGIRQMMAPAEQSEDEVRASEALVKIGEAHGNAPPTAIALAWIMARAPYVFPIVGGRKVEHLEANIKSLEIRLTAEEIQTLNDVQKFDWGFPYEPFGRDPTIDHAEPGFLMKAVGSLDYVQQPRSLTAPQ